MPGSFACGLFIASAVVLGGCASPTVPVPVDTSKTTVILLPDEDGHVGAVSLSTGREVQRIDEAYSFATVQGATSRISPMQVMGSDRVAEEFKELLQAQPPRPRSFILYFLLDKATLTEQSKAMLPELLEAAHARKPANITIFGHADATGSESSNVKLSASRANAIADLMRRSDPELGRIDAQFFGDKEPLFPAKPGVPEPRNRRVEIVIL